MLCFSPGFLTLLLSLISLDFSCLLSLLLFISLTSLFFWLLSLGKFLFNISVVEKIDEFFPFLVLLQLSSENLNFSGQHPVDHGDRVGGSVVAWDGNINEVEWGVRITESDAWDVDVGSLNNSLLITDGISNDQQSGFLEDLGVLVGQGTWGPSRGRGGDGSDELGELEDGSLSGNSGGNDDDVLWVLDGSDGSSSELDLLPGLLEVEDVDSFLVLVGDESLHVEVQVLGSDVAIGLQQSKEVLLFLGDGSSFGGHANNQSLFKKIIF